MNAPKTPNHSLHKDECWVTTTRRQTPSFHSAGSSTNDTVKTESDPNTPAQPSQGSTPTGMPHTERKTTAAGVKRNRTVGLRKQTHPSLPKSVVSDIQDFIL